MRTMLKSKIHRARVTAVNVDYEGSIAIDQELMREADILPYEQVQVLNVNNGERFTTYAIQGKRGEISVKGAAGRLAARGDIVIIVTYAQVADEAAPDFVSRVVYVDAQNRIMQVKELAGAAAL